jgi:hypothetical protein
LRSREAVTVRCVDEDGKRLLVDVITVWARVAVDVELPDGIPELRTALVSDLEDAASGSQSRKRRRTAHQLPPARPGRQGERSHHRAETRNCSSWRSSASRFPRFRDAFLRFENISKTKG